MNHFRDKKYYYITAVAVLVIAVVCIYFYRGRLPNIESVPEVALPSIKSEVIGKSVQGRDIEAFTYGDGSKHLVFVGGIHGGYEWNSVILAYKFINYLNDNQNTIPKDIKITVIPSLNPDGVYKVTGKEGMFDVGDVIDDENILASGRFNANNVDLNRNFDCNWAPTSMWRSKKVSAGSNAFSEPESKAFRDFVLNTNPAVVVFWHSQANAVYASSCNSEVSKETLSVMNAYADASGYKAEKTFDSYAITGDSGDWLSTLDIPSVSVELKTHNSIEWDKNLLGIESLINFFNK